MRTLKLTLAYDGTDFAGWQRQPERRTLQGTLEQVLGQITGAQVTAEASGRTDSGVHALGQVVSFETHSALDVSALHRALNAELPDEMLVLDVCEAPSGFHARFDAVGKRYRYCIHDGPLRDLFDRRYHWHSRYRLDATAMHEAAQALLGTHDFRSFESAWPNRENSIRTITEICVAREVGQGGGGIEDPARHVVVASDPQFVARTDNLYLEVAADGFLYNMVRAIVGTLVEVGRGAQPKVWPAQVLAALDRCAAGMTAPAQGLFLVRVDYPPDAAAEQPEPQS